MTQSGSTEQLRLKELVAMGVGGMVGGGIFSVLGLAVGLAGHAAPLAFFLGGIMALLTGLSYARLGIAFHSDGGSFTYLEHAFTHKNIAGVGGWILLVGYIGTMALYAYTFGVYGAAMLGNHSHGSAVHHLLETFVLLVFLGVNLYGVKASGQSEDLLVMVKVIILVLFSVIGITSITADHVLPVFNQGGAGLLMGAALIFVAYEGFELIPNAVEEMENPNRDLPRAIFISVTLTMAIYLLVSLVAVGNLLPEEISQFKEYALAAAAKPFLGQAGFLLIGLAALLSTASAINATLFGTARLGLAISQDGQLPKAFSCKSRTKNIPYVSLIVLSALTLLFVNLADLTIISAFASSAFLLIFAAINLSALRLRKQIGMGWGFPLAGFLSTMVSWFVLALYLWNTNQEALLWIGMCYLGTILAELAFSRRRVMFRSGPCS